MIVKEGEVVSIVGPSGSGKSTFLRCLNYLESINKGEITIYNDVLKGGSGTVVRKHNETTAKRLDKMLEWFFSNLICGHTKLYLKMLLKHLYRLKR